MNFGCFVVLDPFEKPPDLSSAGGAINAQLLHTFDAAYTRFCAESLVQVCMADAIGRVTVVVAATIAPAPGYAALCDQAHL
jgi:hypothetical protein